MQEDIKKELLVEKDRMKQAEKNSKNTKVKKLERAAKLPVLRNFSCRRRGSALL